MKSLEKFFIRMQGRAVTVALRSGDVIRGFVTGALPDAVYLDTRAGLGEVLVPYQAVDMALKAVK